MCITNDKPNITIIQLMQRADELESCRKATMVNTVPKTPHEQAVDQYCAYVSTLMRNIPQENWFKFTVENMNLIQTFSTKRTTRSIMHEHQPAHLQQHESSQVQQMGYHMQQTPRKQGSHMITGSTSGFVSSGCCGQTAPTAPYSQSYVNPVMSGMSSAGVMTNVSPSSFLNVPSPTYQQVGAQQLAPGMPTNMNMGSSPLSTSLKSTNDTAEVTTSDSSNSDVISFSANIFD
jgi:hypothetical protein